MWLNQETKADRRLTKVYSYPFCAVALIADENFHKVLSKTFGVLQKGTQTAKTGSILNVIDEDKPHHSIVNGPLLVENLAVIVIGQGLVPEFQINEPAVYVDGLKAEYAEQQSIQAMSVKLDLHSSTNKRYPILRRECGGKTPSAYRSTKADLPTPNKSPE